MSFDEDPEVLADRRLRDASERDATRTRDAELNYSAPVFVAAWVCRYPQCPIRVMVTQDALDRVEVFNAELARRGEHPLDVNKIMFCDKHKAMADNYAIGKNAERRTRCRDAIQKLKEHDSPRTATALIDALHKCGHPDVEGLLQSLEERRGNKRGKGKL